MQETAEFTPQVKPDSALRSFCALDAIVIDGGEMAIVKVHVVMQVWTLRTTGQLACSGHVCNLPVKHEKWCAELPRRPEDCKMLLIDRRTPTRGKNKGKMPKPWHLGTKIKTNSPALLMKMGQMFGLGK